MFAARAFNPAVPGTVTEVIALAADSGVTDWYNIGRANFTKLAAGMKSATGSPVQVYEARLRPQAAILVAASQDRSWLASPATR